MIKLRILKQHLKTKKWSGRISARYLALGTFLTPLFFYTKVQYTPPQVSQPFREFSKPYAGILKPETWGSQALNLWILRVLNHTTVQLYCTSVVQYCNLLYSMLILLHCCKSMESLNVFEGPLMFCVLFGARTGNLLSSDCGWFLVPMLRFQVLGFSGFWIGFWKPYAGILFFLKGWETGGGSVL